MQFYRTVFGELDRVGGEVEHDLADAVGVAGQPLGNGGGDAECEVQAFALGQRLQQLVYLFQHGASGKRRDDQGQLVGLDAGQVQCVIDQAQQVLARLLDRFGVTALRCRQRRAEQQFGHAHDPAHRGAYLVAHGRQKSGFRQRRLFRQLTPLFRQFECVAAAQAGAVGQRKQSERNKCGTRIGQSRWRACPPRRIYPHVQRHNLRPVAPGIGGLHLQSIASGRQLCEHALAVAGYRDPVIVVALHAEAIAVRRYIRIREQSGSDAQVAILWPENDGRFVRQPDFVVAAAQRDVFDHQRGRFFRAIQTLIGFRIEQQQAALSGSDTQSISTEQGRTVVKGLAGQAGAHTVQTQCAGVRRVTHQSPRGGRPHLARLADQHATRRHRRKALALVDAQGALELYAVPAVALKSAQQRQPDRTIAGDGKSVDFLLRHASDRLQAVFAGIPGQQAIATGNPECTIGTQADLLDIAGVQPLAIANDNGIEHMAVAVARLQASAQAQ